MQLINILKRLPKGTEVYSRVHGRMGELKCVANDGILIHFKSKDGEYSYDCKFLTDGSLIQGGECMIFEDSECGFWKTGITFEEFREFVLDGIKDRPSFIRKGQAVFNFVDMHCKVARRVQYVDGVDCFYKDDVIEEFLLCAYKQLTK